VSDSGRLDALDIVQGLDGSIPDVRAAGLLGPVVLRADAPAGTVDGVRHKELVVADLIIDEMLEGVDPGAQAALKPPGVVIFADEVGVQDELDP